MKNPKLLFVKYDGLILIPGDGGNIDPDMVRSYVKENYLSYKGKYIDFVDDCHVIKVRIKELITVDLVVRDDDLGDPVGAALDRSFQGHLECMNEVINESDCFGKHTASINCGHFDGGRHFLYSIKVIE